MNKQQQQRELQRQQQLQQQLQEKKQLPQLNQNINSAINKIFIASTPKTGNTWVKLLLSRVYQLPALISPKKFDEQLWSEIGSNWVMHQHLKIRDENIISWFNQQQIPVITTIRHPGDTLVSLFHYSKWADNSNQFSLKNDVEHMGQHTMEYIHSYQFAKLLEISLQWFQRGSLIIRYEDLLADPVSVLHHLTQKISPVKKQQIHSAVISCDIGVLKTTNDKRHFRKGQSGQWVNELPAEAIDFMANDKRYKRIFKQFGYSLETPITEPEYFDYSTISPFYHNQKFDNGLIIPGILIQLYYSTLSHTRKWKNPFSTADKTFYAWIQTAVDDKAQPEKAPKINQIANYIYQQRPDLQKVFPDYLGQDRDRFFKWYQRHGVDEYGLDPLLCDG